MKLPKDIIIGDTVWDIVKTKKLIVEGYECDGWADVANSKIFIRSNLSHESTLSTFIHEVLHGLDSEYDLELEHKLIYKLETAIARLLLDNYI